MQVITSRSKLYPKRLLEIKDHPAELYIEGNPEILNKSSIAIVGSRACTEYGKNQAKRFATYLADKNIAIVSGLALGIDTVAHISSMDKIGKTIAVIASGFNHVFPKENIKLFNKIIENEGCIVSEYNENTEVDMSRFPKRNRIISGISQGVLVVESKYRSGSNITAREAFKQKREVFCIPGNIGSKTSYGTNSLIQQGANLVITPADILESFDNEEMVQNENNKEIQDEYKQVYLTLGTIPMDINEIAKNTNLSISEVSERLVMLELQGKIKNVAGNQYVIEDKNI